MNYFIIWLLTLILIYIFYLVFVILRKKKISNFKNNTYVIYLTRVYKLNVNKIETKKLAHLISFSNAFIVSTTFIIISSIKNFILMMLLAFIVLIPLQLLVYHIIGKQLKRREKDV